VLPIVGPGHNRLQLVCVDNVVDLMMLALDRNETYEGTYIIADKEALNIRELFEYMAKVQGARGPFIIPENLASLLALIPFIGRRLSFFGKDRAYSIQRIKEKLGYVPRISVYDGLKKALLSYGKKI